MSLRHISILADEYKDYFMKTFPGALEEVKKISEAN
jgi:hypothetical protein